MHLHSRAVSRQWGLRNHLIPHLSLPPRVRYPLSFSSAIYATQESYPYSALLISGARGSGDALRLLAFPTVS